MRTRRLTPRAVLIDGTDILLGWRVTCETMTFTYRVAGSHLIVCAFAACGVSPSLQGAVRELTTLLQQLLTALPDVAAVRGMVLPGLRQSETAVSRARLAAHFESLGARWCSVDGERWLTFFRQPPSCREIR